MASQNKTKKSRTTEIGLPLSVSHPKLAREFHSSLNGNLNPERITKSYNDKVYWCCWKNRKHVWQASPHYRIHWGVGCPFCAKSVASLRPDLAKQWHPYKNGSLSPETTTIASQEEVFWVCPEDPLHVWQTKVASRTRTTAGCPYCSRQRICKSNSLLVLRPDVAALWHPKKNGELTPSQVGPAADNKVWWQCPTNRKHVWEGSVYNVAKSTATGCPFCAGQRVDSTNSLAKLHPELLNEWHPTKNESISPHDVTSGSKALVWWQCSKSPAHVWQTIVRNRTRGAGCPYCAHQKLSDENRLTTLFPKIASEWDVKKNKNLQPQDFSYGSKEKVWWKCSLGHSWPASIKSRTGLGCGCPYCAGKLATRETCLKAVYPLVAQQWHPTRNGKLTPLDVLPKSNKRVWWKCIAGHIWEANIYDIVTAREERLTNGCPKCAILERGKRTKYLQKRRKADIRLAKLE